VLGSNSDDMLPKLTRLLLEYKDDLSNGDVHEHTASIAAALIAPADGSDTTADPEWGSGSAGDVVEVFGASS
jgi:hypothetical protein